eukprot:jgi/Astpho2/5883/Aster-x1332
MSDSETIPANYGSNGPMQPPTALAVSDPMQFSTQLLDERWGHSGAFARKPKRQTGGDLHGKMGTLELQMQTLLARMHRHNAGIAARHAAIEQVEGISLKRVRAQYAEAVHVSAAQRMKQTSKGSEGSREDLGPADALEAPAADGSGILPGPHGLLSKFKLRLPAAREPVLHEKGAATARGRLESKPGRGGRDVLAWVRQLVSYTETHPIYIPDDRSSAVALTEDGHVQKTVFPSLRPTRREDAVLLRQWLGDMMGQLLAKGEAMSGASDMVPMEMSDAALWLYGIAFGELQRHVATECRERGELLGCMWDHCCSLVELRCALQYEAQLTSARAGFDDLNEQRRQLKAEVRDLQDELEEAVQSKEGDAIQMERQNQVLVHKVAEQQQEIAERDEQIAKANKELQAERTHRGEMDTLLDQTREQLDASRRECGGLHGEVAQRLKEIQALQGELRVTKRELGDRLHELALLQGREHEYVQQVATMETSYQKLKNDFASDEVLLVALREQLSQRASELAALRQHNAELSTRSMRLEADLAHEVQGATVVQQELLVVLQERDNLRAGLQRDKTENLVLGRSGQRLSIREGVEKL